MGLHLWKSKYHDSLDVKSGGFFVDIEKCTKNSQPTADGSKILSKVRIKFYIGLGTHKLFLLDHG